jgi:hypothetical protein
VRPGSRVRLLRSQAVIRLGTQALFQPPPSTAGSTKQQQKQHPPAYCMAVVRGATPPAPATQLLVGSEACRVLRGSWLGTCPAPKVIVATTLPSSQPLQSSLNSHAPPSLPVAHVCCVAVSPHAPDVFVAARSDGGASLHSTRSSQPAMEWPAVGLGTILGLAWCPSRPACFIALDGACQLHWFDLSKVRKWGGVAGGSEGDGDSACVLACE